MDVKPSRILHILFALLFILFVSAATADDDVAIVSAGVDQVVNAGDDVLLSGNVIYQDDEHKHRKHKKRGKKHRENGHHDKYEKRHHRDDDKRSHREDDNDELQVVWLQTAGTPVNLVADNTLKPSFTAPDVNGVLVFTLQIIDDDGDLLGSDSVSITVKAPNSTISGRVTTVDGSILGGVNIKILAGGSSIGTGATATDGQFELQLPALSDVVLQLSASGYADQIVPARSPKANGQIFLNIRMIAQGAIQSFNGDLGGTISGDDGAAVTVAGGSFVDTTGSAVTGNIDVTITPVDVSRPATLAAFPGEFSGVLTGDTTDTPIISMGTVEYEFSQNGQPLQLAPGATAEVLLPIYIASYQDGSPIQVGDTIPLWSLNEATGIWQQEGSGSVVPSSSSPTGLAMQATVSHFSWWNCDVSANSAQAIITVFGPDTGTALIKARTNADIGWRPDTVDTVGEVGIATNPLYIPSNGEVCFWAEIVYDNGSTGTTPEVCVSAAPSSLINIDLLAPAAGPVNITTRPPATADVLDVEAYPDYPARPVTLQPTTYETAVTYTIISGALPVGMSLNPVTTSSAEITGIPTVVGDYSVVVQATDSDGFTDTITVNYHVTTVIAAPDLTPAIDISYVNVPYAEDMNNYNNGGPVASWTLTTTTGDPAPAGITIDPITGVITVSDWCYFWSGTVTATNANGSSSASIYIENWGCW